MARVTGNARMEALEAELLARSQGAPARPQSAARGIGLDVGAAARNDVGAGVGLDDDGTPLFDASKDIHIDVMRSHAQVGGASDSSATPKRDMRPTSSTTTTAGEGDETICDVSFIGDTTQRALLKASPPQPVGSTIGRYMVRIRRACLRQPFGIYFDADGDVISISEDLPHLGLRQYDQLIKVNGRKLTAIEEYRRVMLQSISLELVLQHRESKQYDMDRSTSGSVVSMGVSTAVTSRRGADWPSNWFVRDGGEAPSGLSDWFTGAASTFMPLDTASQYSDSSRSEHVRQLPLRVLLSASRPILTDENCGEFQVEIKRTSLKQRFGIPFAHETDDLPTIMVAEDLPQYGLRMGDALLSLNGVQRMVPDEAREILERSMSITLKLQRNNMTGFAQPAFLEPIEEFMVPMDASEHIEHFQALTHQNRTACGGPFVWCSGGGIQV